MNKLFDVIYTKQEGFFRNNVFVIKKTTEHTHTLFADNKDDTKKLFIKETNVGENRIKKIVESTNDNNLGSLFPALSKLKEKLS